MNDLISKSEVYKLFNNGCGIEKIHVAQIDDIPIVDAEPVKHGHWIYNKENGEVKCSRCRAEVAVTMCATDLEEILADENYCFKCGAKMDEVIE